MDKRVPTYTVGNGPEAKIQDGIVKMLRYKGWYVKRIPGSVLLSGIPDLFVSHSRYGHRWVEVKLPEMRGSHFTAAQLEEFPKLCANGSGVWIITAPTSRQYDLLFRPPNFDEYLLLTRLRARGTGS